MRLTDPAPRPVMSVLRLVPLALLGACGGGDPPGVPPTPPPGELLPEATIAGGLPADGLEKVAKLELLPPFSAQLVAAEPSFKNPVAFTVDAQGRLYVAETNRYLHSVFDVTQQTQWLRDDMALRSVDDRAAFLKRTFAAEPTRLTERADVVRRLEDRDGDGRYEASTQLGAGFHKETSGPIAGITAHGEQLFVGCIPELAAYHLRDGRLSAQTLHSGFGVHIGVSGHDLHGLVVGPDKRLYFTIGDRGTVLTTKEGKRIDLPDTGAAFRCELDGSQLEVVAVGLRNPQELAFDMFGNLVTVDNDTAGTDPCRVLHLVDGGDYGWRYGYQYMTDFGAWQSEKIWDGVDDVLPHAGHIAQGPAGLAYVPGPAVSEELVDSFLICDFPGGVRSFRLRPHGASYVAEDGGKLVWGLWPTDLAIGPDSAIYVSDWVSGWQRPERGRIYKLFEPAARDRTAAEARQALRDLLAGNWHARSDQELIALLAHEDQRVRQASHMELSERPVALPQLQQAVRADAPPLTRLHALWALSILARRDESVCGNLLPVVGDPAPELRAVTARALGEARVPEALAAEVTAALVKLLEDPSPRVRLFAGLALARRPDAPPRPLWQMLERDGGDPYLRHAALSALRCDALLRELPGAASQGSAAQRLGLALAWRRAGDPRIATLLDDSDPAVATAALRAIHDVPIPAAYAAGAALQRDLGEATTRRVLNLCVRVGDAAAAQRLVSYAARTDAPAALRQFAIAALGRLPAPDAVDPVVGCWLPLPKRDAAPAQAALLPQLPALLADADDALVVATLRTTQILNLAAAGEATARLAAQPQRSGVVRAEACRTLAALGDGSWQSQADQLLGSDDAATRIAVLDLLLSQPGPTAIPAARLLGLVDGKGAVRERQAALRLLARAQDGTATLLELTKRGRKLAPQLAIDLRAAVAGISDPALTAALAAWPPRDDELFVGGDAARGRDLFMNRAELQCLRCHAVGGEGGTLGPALDQIGKRPAPELLLSLRDPNAQLAAGWPSGTPSAMPPGLDRLLSAAELRDLLAYLQSLR